MAGEKITLNLSNGNKFVLKEGMNAKNLNSEEKAIFSSLFDFDSDGILSKEEANFAKNFTSGIFTVKEHKKGTDIEYREETDKNGIPEYFSRWEFDKEGKYTGRIKDSDGDGKIDYIERSEYDKNGKLTKMTVDKNGDGKPDEICEYDKNGYPIKLTVDNNGDGKLDEVKYENDENGNLIRATVDYDGDGKPEYTCYRKKTELS